MGGGEQEIGNYKKKKKEETKKTSRIIILSLQYVKELHIDPRDVHFSYQQQTKNNFFSLLSMVHSRIIIYLQEKKSVLFMIYTRMFYI